MNNDWLKKLDDDLGSDISISVIDLTELKNKGGKGAFCSMNTEKECIAIYLNGLELDTFPEIISKFTKLEYLDIRNNNLKKIPHFLCKLVNNESIKIISDLNIEKCKKNKFIFPIIAIVIVAIVAIKFTHVFDTKVEFKNEIVKNKVIKILKDNIYNDELNSMTELDLSNQNISKIDDNFINDIKKLRNLQKLDLSGNKKINNVKDLNKLNKLLDNVIFQNNKIKKDSSGFICKEPFSEYHGTGICELNIKFKNDIVKNKVKETLENLGVSNTNILYGSDLNKVTKLDLSNQNILNIDNDFINDIRKLKKLTELNLSGNKIRDILPLVALKNLTELNLSGNEGINNIKVLNNLEALGTNVIFPDTQIIKKENGGEFICNANYHNTSGICIPQQCSGHENGRVRYENNLTCNFNGTCRERDNGVAVCSCNNNLVYQKRDCSRFKCSSEEGAGDIKINAARNSKERWINYKKNFCNLDRNGYCNWTTDDNEKNVKLLWSGEGDDLSCTWKCNNGFHLENSNCVPNEKEFLVKRDKNELYVKTKWDNSNKIWGKYCKAGNKIICDNEEKEKREKSILLTFSNENYKTLSANWDCNNGYKLNETGYSCDDIDECAVKNGGCGDKKANKCTNTKGSFTCTCQEEFHEEGNTCVSNTKNATCTPIAPPANATIEKKEVQIKWDKKAKKWSTATDCAWSCNTGFHKEDDKCVSNTKSVNCTTVTPPDNATMNITQVEVLWSNNSWSIAANCAWSCNTGFHKEDDKCVSNTKSVNCTTVTPPDNATMNITQVEVLWNNNSWSIAANCTWSCNTGFHKEDDKCVKYTENNTKKDTKKEVNNEH